MSTTVPQGPTGAMSSSAAERFAARVSEVRDNIGRVIKGKTSEIELALVCFFAEGHLLVEDVPGVGKTQLARALAASIDGEWHRIQFTPDLLPSDVTGVTIYQQHNSAFEFHPGPIFGNVVVADEINRASPRTQSALLEVMEERQVTIDGHPHRVPRPFIVIATQNPIDMDGTYPLPEAQLDRFLMRMSMGYPEPSAELEILYGQTDTTPQDRLQPVLSIDDAAAMVRAVNGVHAAPEVCEYLIRIVDATRRVSEIRLPVSPRGSVGLLRAARSRALLRGRPFITPDDVKSLVEPVLAHRVLLAPDASLAGHSVASLLERIVASVPVPHDRSNRA